MRKKMIEVAIPLDAINKESAREKSIRHGHPSTLHLWWARRPLAACRAVLFASLVDDPESDPANHTPEGEVDDEKVKNRRAELFHLISDLVHWDNANDEGTLSRARAEIASSCTSARIYDSKEWGMDTSVCGEPASHFLLRRAQPGNVRRFLQEYAPVVHDPFAGGGSIPLEAQRLGLKTFASDLNPVPVLINKALIELPCRFAGQPPVNPAAKPTAGKAIQKRLAEKVWEGPEGLTDDIRYYASWMLSQAKERIGRFYPKVEITANLVAERPELEPYLGQERPAIAWIWARTVASPNPATGGVPVPLLRSFWLSTKKGNEAWAEPVISADGKSYRFEVRTTKPPQEFDPSKGTVGRNGAKCLLSEQPISLDYIRSEGKAGRLGARLIAVVVEAPRRRSYLTPTPLQEDSARVAIPDTVPDTPLPEQALGFRVQLYGMDHHWKIFTARQLVALSTLSDLVVEARKKIEVDAAAAGCSQPTDYANAVSTYLAFCVDKNTVTNCTLATWQSDPDRLTQAMSRQALPMTWDYAEANPLSDAGGGFGLTPVSLTEVLERLPRGVVAGIVSQRDATTQMPVKACLVSTDPPYYDNIGYSDLSDWFYVWLRRSLVEVYPDLFQTLLTPKTQELIATPFRHEGSRAKATEFFERGLGEAFKRMHAEQNADYPVTVFYAFKQAETDSSDDRDEDGPEPTTATASTGWETMLEGLITAGFTITGTWPTRTELTGNLKKKVSALASSIVLVCRPRSKDAPMLSRRDFMTALKKELPVALRGLQSGNIAPVDLAQAAIGPGMAIYSRYAKVVESSGGRLTVRTALALINQVLDEVLAEQEGDYDSDTRWSLKWFEQYAHDDGPFGDANTLATAMSIGINGLVDTGIVLDKAGKVRLLKRTELMSGHPELWDPATDDDIVHWEVCQYLIHALDTKGEAGAAALLRRINARYPGAAETARELAYRLYTICERKKWAQEAMAYNSLIVAWPEIVKLSQSSDGSGGEAQTTMF
jgi:putative DNA methylase